MRNLLFVTLPALMLLVGCLKQPASTDVPEKEPAHPISQRQQPPQGKPVDYLGTWSASDEQGEPFDIVLFQNGQAVTTWVKGTSGARGERAFWRIVENELLVFTDSGWTDRILPSETGFLHRGYAPVSPLETPPPNESVAKRLDQAQADFVGIWRLNKEPDGSYLYVTLQAGGRAYSTINGKTEGKWELTPKGALCTWPDGWVDLIERGENGFQKSSWIGAPKDPPADASPATRVGESRFAITP